MARLPNVTTLMLRKIIFWTHLVAGLIAGIAIAVMSFTGAVLAFEKDLIVWAEREARIVAVPSAPAQRLTLNETIARAQAAQPTLRFSNVAVAATPDAAVMLAAAGNRAFSVNPYTGDVREATAPRMRAFMQSMRTWHTRFGVNPPGRGNWGASLNAAANVAFVVLGLTGLVIWWPRAWHWRALRPALWFTRAAGRARDWNWHNVIGIWSLPLLLLLAGTGVVLSYRWANEAVFRLAGETLPAQPAPPPANARPPAPAATPAAPSPSVPLAVDADARLKRVQAMRPAWETITLRFAPPIGAPAGSAKTFSATVKERDAWPVFAVTTVTFDEAGNGAPKIETFADLSSGNRARRWIRLLHSGEALGRVVQALSGLACLGACVLVYTGFALAWRRFFGKAGAA